MMTRRGTAARGGAPDLCGRGLSILHQPPAKAHEPSRIVGSAPVVHYVIQRIAAPGSRRIELEMNDNICSRQAELTGNCMVIIKAVDGLNETVGRIVSVVAVIFAAIIIFDVVMRYVFNAPTRWAFDVTKQLYGFYFVMLGGYALRHQAHVKVDILTERMQPVVRRWVEVAGYAIFFFPFAWVFATRSWDFALKSWNQGETTYGSVQLPVYPLKMAMAAAAALLFLQGIVEVLKLILDKQEKPHGA
jgi:TRAP-type mannitol/chloroaromatic compound transport system permease small subunit